jgi:hypothetical protein
MTATTTEPAEPPVTAPVPDGPPTTCTPADFGWAGQPRYFDYWDLLCDPDALVPFGKVVSAHFETIRQNGDLRQEALVAERALRRRFEQQQGRIQNSFYCSMIRAGAALTEREVGAGSDATATRRLHTVLNSPVATLVRLESDCSILADQALAAFGDRPKQLPQMRVTTDAVYSVMTRVLSAADVCATAQALPADKQAALEAARDEYEAVRLRVWAVIQRQCRFTYFLGVLIGSAVALVLAACLGLVVAHNWSTVVSTPAVVSATVFGVLGAVTSVFQRMSTGRLLLDFNASRTQMILLGALRPFVGAVLGLVVQFALIGGLFVSAPRTETPAASFGFFALIGFIAGFSERFATDMIERAGQVIGGATPGATPLPGTAALPRAAVRVSGLAGITDSGPYGAYGVDGAAPGVAPGSGAGDLATAGTTTVDRSAAGTTTTDPSTAEPHTGMPPPDREASG